MYRVPTVGLTTAAVLFFVDQVSKYLVTGVLGLNALSEARVVTPFFAVRFVANHGVSLGLLHADNETMRWALVALTGAIAAGVAVWMMRERNPLDRIALGMVLGGALGNILDRVRLGYVVDFCDLHVGEWRPFLVFNVADAAITIGVLLLLARALLGSEDRKVSVENGHA